jgi:hypothetical protein
MEVRDLDGLTLYYEAGEREAAELIARACRESVQLISELWDLEPPEDCRVYVMTSWRRFAFQSAPWPRRVLMALLYPLWAPGIRRAWPQVGGYAQRYGHRRVVGLKPPRLIKLAQGGAGERIFLPLPDAAEKVRHNTCHELAHAFVDHLDLPDWLKEGLAMVTVDRFAGGPTVRPETVDSLARSRGEAPAGRTGLDLRDPDAVVYLYVRGYWLTRFLHETQPGLLQGLLAHRHDPEALERQVSAALGIPHGEFWREIDGLVAAHFGQGVGP